MKHHFVQKALSVLLALVLVFSLSSVSFAAGADKTPVIVVSGMGSRDMTVHDSGKRAFPPATDNIVKGVFLGLGPILSAILFGKGILFDKYGADALLSMFADLACDEDGKSVKQLDSVLFPDSVDHYRREFEAESKNELGFVRAVADKHGWKNTYFFNYDWRMSPLDIANDLAAMVQFVKDKHGAKKVSLFAMSMGGDVLSAYLYQYGADDIKTAVYASTAFLGVEMVSNLLSGKLFLNTDALLTYFVPFLQSVNLPVLAKIFDLADKAAEKDGMDTVNAIMARTVKAIKDPMYQKIFKTTFARFPGVWSFVPVDDYETCKEASKSYTTLSDAFWAKADKMHDVQAHTKDLIAKAQKGGTNVYIIGAYGFAGIPVSEAYANHTDMLIDTHLMSGHCAVAPYGKTLADAGYTTGGGCGNKSHYHISTDNVIDASVGLLPEHTWLIRGMGHVEFPYGTGASELGVWLITSEEPVTVQSDARYPQFVSLDRETGKLVSLTQNVTIPAGEQTPAKDGFFQKIAAFFRNLMLRLLAVFG